MIAGVKEKITFFGNGMRYSRVKLTTDYDETTIRFYLIRLLEPLNDNERTQKSFKY